MNPGDRIRIHIHDTPAGFRVDLTDLTTDQTGSMTASVANGFGARAVRANVEHVPLGALRVPPEYSTANPRGNTWSAHTYNVAFSDEIGHFEHCNALDANFNCAVAGSDDPTLDSDDDGCVPGKDAWARAHHRLLHGAGDVDFDGPSYQNDWPGNESESKADQRTHPEPVVFTSPTTVGGSDYSTIAFETDLPRIEDAVGPQPPARPCRFTGVGCSNPPNGARVLSVLLHPLGPRRVCLAGGRRLHPGHDQRLRRQLSHRVRNRPVGDVLSGAEQHPVHPVEQLQQRRPVEPLPGERVAIGDRRASTREERPRLGSLLSRRVPASRPRPLFFEKSPVLPEVLRLERGKSAIEGRKWAADWPKRGRNRHSEPNRRLFREKPGPGSGSQWARLVPRRPRRGGRDSDRRDH